MSHKTGREIIDSALSALRLNEEGGTLDQRLERLGGKIGYATRTLRGIYYGDVKLTSKFQKWISKLVHENEGIEAQTIRAGGLDLTLIQPKDGYKGYPLKIPHKANFETADLLISVIEDFKNSTGLKRHWLAEKICELAEMLRDHDNGAPAQTQSQEQKPTEPNT
ncbi:hypothetical protein BH09VER1_BH09VER1_24770 [soil metagenome]